ncbi:hypothetical protein GCM10010377_79170 [Streptomyces viridiviolaceus]|nr:hypothetical protein GCM10010377_79170 [Streptomyces viridiviolaceus]
MDITRAPPRHRPRDARQDLSVGAPSAVVEHLAREHPGPTGHYIADGMLGVGRSRHGADTVRAVPVAVLRALSGDEGGRLLDAADQVRVVGVHAGVQDGDLHAAAGQQGPVGPGSLKAPGYLVLVPGRTQRGGDLGPGVLVDLTLVAAVGRIETG